MGKEQMLIDVCLLAGRMMAQAGAETYRVEDTMTRMAAASGFPNSQSFVTPTVVMFHLEAMSSTHFARVNERGTDLEKIALVNSISRRMAEGEINLDEAHKMLKKLDEKSLSFPAWLQVVAAALASGSFLLMFKGTWNDYLPAAFIGGAGFIILLIAHYFSKVKLFAEFFAAFVIGGLAVLSVRLGLGRDLDLIIIASVMPLVPGVLITNAIRDLMAGHFMAGVSKGAEAFLTAFAIGAGVAVVFSFFV
ncbi:threonine/serine exporter family protein [Siminovitchia sp. 179-K 8D1 HS]|uniref:threonine/serine exporter family protein n=1 Tax=Siminovitchia sp. 179-K 8D1 HS TaxID=3142385 RepID=UPI0039A1749E